MEVFVVQEWDSVVFAGDLDAFLGYLCEVAAEGKDTALVDAGIWSAGKEVGVATVTADGKVETKYFTQKD